jgi:hypothetical protein
MNSFPQIHDTWSRRSFLQAGAAASGLMRTGLEASRADAPRGPFIDVNVNLSRWPLRRLPCDEPQRLVAKLRSRGITQAWTGTFDGLLHKDLSAANARLTEDCRRFGEGLLLPFGSINPTLPDWFEEIRRCAQVHQMPGIRLHPNYHGYTLEDPRFERLLQHAVELKLIVQLALVMEDERMMHPRLRVEPVDPEPLVAIVHRTSRLRVVLLNALRTLRDPLLSRLLGAGDVYVDLAMLEGVGGLESLLVRTPVDRILFGSHAPLFYFEAAELKLRESQLTREQSRAICFENVARLLDATSGGR